MRITGDNTPADKTKGKLALRAAIEAGYNHFDQADIYGDGHCETLFGEFLTELTNNSSVSREQLIITSKAGIKTNPQHYDFSRQHLINSVDASLKRLNTDYLDMFLLHRPDYLFNAEQVAATFQYLHEAGKVKHFGVSNFSPSQVNLLQSALDMPLLVNQVEINVHNIERLLDGTLDQCQQHKITPIAWCPLGGVAYPAWGNTFTPAVEQRIAKELDRQSNQYHCQPWQVILAWLLKHPANICPIIGSTTPERIIAAKQALCIEYGHKDWYRLLEARNGFAQP
jgi:predicted oxidoreductase